MESPSKTRIRQPVAAIITIILLAFLPQLFIAPSIQASVVSIAGVCIFLWISELVPPFVTTLVLWTLVPLILEPFDPKFGVANVLLWGADPVMGLFFGGLALGVATARTGLDGRVTTLALKASRNSYILFLFFIISLTAFFSMWVSNIAAAALVFSSLQPVLAALGKDHILRRTLLVAVAFGANFGGIATPVGTGPNAIAIASISGVNTVSFFSWMLFAFPLMVGMLMLSFSVLISRGRKHKTEWSQRNEKLTAIIPKKDDSVRLGHDQKTFLMILLFTAIGWLTESIHGVPSAVIALAATAALFISRVLKTEDLPRIDWSTLLLISGGITLGKLLEQSGIVKTIAMAIPFADLHPVLILFLLCLISATLSALMSNTATVILLIPLATAFIPAPSTAILVAISASFGIPFIISTPPNIMAFGQGGLKFGDVFWPGIFMMLLGCFLISVTGKQVLNFAGIP